MKDEIKGKADELKGKLTGNKSEEMKGKAEQAADKVRRAGRDIREDVREKTDEERDKEAREREAESVREPKPWELSSPFMGRLLLPIHGEVARSAGGAGPEGLGKTQDHRLHDRTRLEALLPRGG